MNSKNFTQLLITLLFAILSNGNLFAEPLTLEVSAENCILINADTGDILFEKNSKTPAFPASITKVSTALFALKKNKNRLEELVTVKSEAIASITPEAKKQSNYKNPSHWLETDGSHIGLKKGEQVPFRDLLYAVLMSSANDASNVIAQHVGGTIPKFLEELNEYLKEIGCLNTHFLNPHGLHHPNHISSAYDMALIAKEAMKEPLFRQIVSTVRYTCPMTNLEGERIFLQTNLLLRKGAYHYPAAIGIKTGTTLAAGKTLIAAARQDNRTLIAVVFGCKAFGARYTDVIHLFDAAFNQPKMRKNVLAKGLQTISVPIKGSKKPLKTYLDAPLYYDYYPAEEPSVKAAISWNLPPLPIEKGQRIGVVKIQDQRGVVISQQPLLAFETIEPTFMYRIQKLFNGHEKQSKKGIFLFGIGCVVLFFLFLRKKKKPRRTLRR